MGATVRSILARFSPVFWLAAVALGVSKAIDPVLHLTIWAVIATGAAASGTASGAITATASHDKSLLLAALLANRPPRGEAAQENPARDLHAV